MFQEPDVSYGANDVNMWVTKKWKSDGSRIPCHIMRHENKEHRNILIYSHGNAENLQHAKMLQRLLYDDLKVDVVVYDYPGYGLNTYDIDERNADGFNITLESVIDQLTTEYKYDVSNMIFMSYSLGTGPSLHNVDRLCTQKRTPPKAVITMGAFTSIKSLIQEHTNKLISDVFEERWDCEKYMKTMHSNNVPTLIIHGERDTLIPVKHAKRFSEINPDAKLVLSPTSGHTTLIYSPIVQSIKQWLSKYNNVKEEKEDARHV